MFRIKTNQPRRVLWVGKKTIAWVNARARLKRKFLAAGITSCELQYPDCAGDNFLGFAHGRKRRHLQDGELESLVILACNNCHDRIERMSPEGMLAIVQSTIADRNLAA